MGRRQQPDRRRDRGGRPQRPGGVLGERIELIAADDFCDPDQALVAAQKLVDAGVVLAIGHHCSHSTTPASKVYAEAGILMITPFTTNPRLTEQGFPTVFRMCGRDDLQGAMAGEYLAARSSDARIAIHARWPGLWRGHRRGGQAAAQ